MYISEISMQSVVVIVISSSILCTFPCFLVCSYILLKIVMFRQQKWNLFRIFINKKSSSKELVRTAYECSFNLIC